VDLWKGGNDTVNKAYLFTKTLSRFWIKNLSQRDFLKY
jgi:hypothetical protein